MHPVVPGVRRACNNEAGRVSVGVKLLSIRNTEVNRDLRRMFSKPKGGGVVEFCLSTDLGSPALGRT